jgi:peptidoglycan/xylan/chitin deacetylase (PgdA/CDA1 family)
MPALMYHDVVPEGAEDSSGFPGRAAGLYKVTPAAFDSHLRAIVAATRSAPSQAADDSASSITLTFDDGGASAMTAAEALERHGLRGQFFVTVNYLGARGFLDAAALRDLRRRGHIIGSHSCSHPFRMGHCTPTQLLDEWTKSRDVLSSLLGESVRTASVPGGDYAPAVAEAAAEAGFTTLFTSEPALSDEAAGGLVLRGRFAIQRWTTARTASALARGAWLPCTRQTVIWNAKKMSKRLWGERYLRIRAMILDGRGAGSGDRPEIVRECLDRKAP